MVTKRIQRRNANILKYHQRYYSNRQIGRIMHLSHTQIANILRKLENKVVAQ
jgi:DNA-binding Lrp family transcriptional regulator